MYEILLICRRFYDQSLKRLINSKKNPIFSELMSYPIYQFLTDAIESGTPIWTIKLKATKSSNLQVELIK